MQPTRLVPALLALSLAASLGGCPRSGNERDNSTDARPFEGVSLTIAVPDAFAPAQNWPIVLDEWSARTGAAYELTRYDQAGTAEGVVAAASGADGSGPDVLLFPLIHRAELVCRGLLQPMPLAEQDQEHLDWDDYLRGVRHTLGEPRRKPTIAPLSAPVLVCYYRRDLLEAAGLQPPETWSAYRKLIESSDDWAPGKSVVEPWGPDHRATTFLSRAAPHAKHPGFYSFLFDIDSGAPLIGTAGFVRALEQARADVALMPEEVTTFSPAQCRAEILSGRAAIALALESAPDSQALPFGPGRAATPAEASSSISRGPDVRISMCRLPGTDEVYNRSTERWESPGAAPINRAFVTGFAGVGLGVGARSGDLEAQAAWNLIEELTLDNQGGAFPPLWAGHVRTSDVQSAAASTGRELTAEEKFQYVYVVSESLRDLDVVAELPVLDSQRFRDQLTAALTRAFDEPETPAQQILTDLATEWNASIEQIGAEKFRDCYREMLGLPPL